MDFKGLGTDNLACASLERVASENFPEFYMSTRLREIFGKGSRLSEIVLHLRKMTHFQHNTTKNTKFST
jgi:hypothetical protein